MDRKTITILLVEDSQATVGMIKEMLQDSDNSGFSKYFFDVDHQSSVSTALEQLIRKKTDLILLDLNLPDSEGLDTFTKMYEHVPYIPIVILTGIEDELMGIKALQMGALDYWPKAEISRNILIRIINYAMLRHRFLNELEACVEERTQEVLAVNQQLQQEVQDRKKRQQELQQINDNLLKVQQDLEEKITFAEKNHINMVRQVSELTLSKADLTQNRMKMKQEINSLGQEKETLQDQLVLYYEALQEANIKIDELLIQVHQDIKHSLL